MATVTLLSAKGSPGASALTVGLALSWASVLPGRAAVAVDADPAGGGLAAGILGGRLNPGSGMLPLATSRGLDAMEAVTRATVDLRPDGAARLIAGVPDSTRSGALGLAWEVLSKARHALAQSGTDLLVDAGRVDLARPIPPWLTDTDLVLLVVRPTLPAVAAAHRFVANWSSPAGPTSAGPTSAGPTSAGPTSAGPASTAPLEMVIVAAPSPYRPDEVAAAVGVPCRAVIPFDPDSARVHSEGMAPSRGFARSSYARAVAGLAADVGSRFGVTGGDASALVETGAALPKPGPGGA